MNRHRISYGIKRLVFLFLSLLIALASGSVSQIQAYASTNDAREIPNAVYEQVELISLVFRLADSVAHWVFSDEDTDYQRSLEPAFRDFADHPIMERTRDLTRTRGIGFDAPIIFAIHLEKADGLFQFVYGARVWELDTRWTPEIANEYLMLLNDFYIVSSFNAFFEENTAYFEWHSQRLHDELMGKINFGWFYQFGFNPASMRTIIRPSGTRGHFGPTFLDTINYAVIGQRTYPQNYGDLLPTTVHEFAHSFANPIAEAWYEEDENFRNLMESAASTVTRYNPFYTGTITAAKEYVTRAFTILYLVENHDKDLLRLLLDEYNIGFRNIEAVYAMITEHEPMITRSVRLAAWLSGNAIIVASLGGGIIFGSIVGAGIVLFEKNKKAKRGL